LRSLSQTVNLALPISSYSLLSYALYTNYTNIKTIKPCFSLLAVLVSYEPGNCWAILSLPLQ